MRIAVFRVGTHTDMSGRSRNFTLADLDTIAGKYDSKQHEAPVVIGHPRTNSPAWGWVNTLGREGDILYADLKQVAPEFSGWLHQGRYKKRSISLYPDGTLKHVGFLGAMPPAVKGLPDSGFAEDQEAIIYEFAEKENTMELKEFFEGLKFWQDQSKGMTVSEPSAKPADAGAQFSEADVKAATEKAVAEALEAERQRLTLEFAEKEKQAAQNARSEAIKAEVAQLVASGKLPPAWAKSGLCEFMAQLDAAAEYQFAEGADKQSPLAWFRQFISELPQVLSFSEFATRGKDVSGDAAGKLEALTRKKMTDNKDISYTAAFCEVQTENPDLAREYAQSI